MTRWVVTKLDRLARSLPDARAIADELTSRQVKLALGTGRPIRSGGCCPTCWPWSPEFEADLIRARTREGMRVAKAKGRLRGKRPKLSRCRKLHLVELYRAGAHTVSELEELFERVARLRAVTRR